MTRNLVLAGITTVALALAVPSIAAEKPGGAATPPGDKATALPADKNAPTVDASSFITFKTTAIVGADAINVQGDRVGEVEEVLVAANGIVRGVLIEVGGFLGIGKRTVAVDWRDLTLTRDGEDVRVLVKLNNDQLKALPEYAENR